MSGSPWARWMLLAASAQGNKVVAATWGATSDFGFIYTSQDGGTNWTITSAPLASWEGLASSADGNTIVAVAYYDYIYVSTNSGLNWTTAVAPNTFWSSVACSADGSRMTASVQNRQAFQLGTLYTSSDYGVTWTNEDVPQESWWRLAESAEGTSLLGAISGDYGGPPGPIYASMDSGVSWARTDAPDIYWESVACSADGCKQVASGYGGIYTRQTTPHPVLNVIPNASKLILSWVIPSIPFVLQQTSGLDNGWADVLITPVLNSLNLHYEVSVPKPTGTVFYRLASR